jgi:hypothetical protein
MSGAKTAPDIPEISTFGLAVVSRRKPSSSGSASSTAVQSGDAGSIIV